MEDYGPKNKLAIGTLALVVVVLAAAVGFSYWTGRQFGALNEKIAETEKSLSALQTYTLRLATTTQKSISALEDFAKKQGAVMAQKSQDQLLTAAVAKTAPAVVSIVISEEVPQLQVSYVNPFGDDPNFRDFGIRVPVYRQIGSSLQKVGAGTGFIVSPNGYIVTNKHVVGDADAKYTVLLQNGVQKPAQVSYLDRNSDIAVIKIDGSYPTVAELGNSSALSLGQSVIAIGNALGEYGNSVSVGIISGLNRNITAADSSGVSGQLKGVIQTDAAINPGNSGGPLLDLSGKVVGVNVATVVGSSNIAFAIPIDSVRSAIGTFVR